MGAERRPASGSVCRPEAWSGYILRSLRARTVTGPGVFGQLGSALDDLCATTGAPVTARVPWLRAWASSYQDHQPWAVIVEDGSGALAAAAVLARRRRRGIMQIVALGHGESDYVRLPAAGPEAATALGRALVATLRALPGPWVLKLEQLPVGDPAARVAADGLRWSARLPGDGAPVVRFGPDRSERSIFRRSLRQDERKRWNRLRREGRVAELTAVQDPASISALLPEIERVWRARDASLVRQPTLDDPRAAGFWRTAVEELARLGEVEVTTLRIDGELAAYAVCFLDGHAYRMWNCRFAPRWGWFGPGSLVSLATIRNALADGRFTEYDHMRGVEPFKLRTATSVEPAEHLVAWSSRPVRARMESPEKVKAALKRWKGRHPAVERAWLRVKVRAIRLER
jgi:CelD/BcsL family acetyltransferase involved in cellulose biosynthesis